MYQYAGLSCYSFAKIGKNNGFKFRKKNMVINILLIASILVLTYISTSKCYASDGNDVTSVSLNMQFVISFVVAPILWFAGQAYSGRMVKLIRSIDDVDKSLRVITKNEFLFSRNRCHLYWLIYLRRTFLVVQTVIQLAATNEYFKPLCYTSYVITQIILMNYGCMYLFLVNYQKQLFDLINYYIKRLLSDNRKIVCLETIIAPKVDICYKLEDIRFIYSKLSDTVAETNKVFQVALLIKTVWTFIFSLFCVYSIIDMFSYPEEYWVILTPFLHSIVQFLVLIVLDFIVDIYAHEALIEKVR